jgi:chromate reductase
MGNNMKIIGISGSLRKDSYHTALLKAAAPIFEQEGATFQIYDISDIPFYNGDVEDAGMPEPVTRLTDAISKADGLFFASPEYNRSVSGVLKNTIDWASRPPFQSVFVNKLTAIISASRGPFGGVQSQANLREIMHGVMATVFSGKGFILPFAGEAIAEDGTLVDEQAGKMLTEYVKDYISWVKKMQKIR